MDKYDYKQIEKKWQDKWFASDVFNAVDFDKKAKYYVLYEFYNISGNLHMGHLKGTVPADALARMKRLQGYNVLFPIGGDSFGLPAENAAIKKGIDPHDFVANGMRNVINQSKALGLSFDYSRAFCTSDEDYYKWTQWIFLKLLENGKAYKETGVVNFCPKCKTVLSNEDSQGGKCDRCGSEVLQVERAVWFLKMKEYSEKLLENVEKIKMSDNLKEAQRNWIGKSEGINVTFKIANSNNEIIGDCDIFTTCIETIYGVTFLVLAPENKLINKFSSEITNMSDIQNYKNQTALRSEFDRISCQKDKTGCKVDGIYAINPANGKKVSIYLGDFVLNSYGSGAVMAVPSHDQRDFEFAQKFEIDFIQVIEGDTSTCAVEKAEYLSKNSKMLNSEEFTGKAVKDAKIEIADKLIKLGFAKKQINYKMQDWPFNRQRYWGEPFPVVYCDKCGIVPLAESDLPLTLPATKDYLPNEKGDSPLSKIESWVNCTCPKCGGAAKRETDTMPNWAGSSWYWLRYTDPHNKNALADYKKLQYWGSVDCYTGGTEHITRHVLYAFFWQNFLYEIGAVPTREPFIRKMGSGLILDDQGKKMSKSSVNGVSPLEVMEKYGTDATRLHLHFLAGYEDSVAWTYKGIEGIVNFLSRVWSLPDILRDGDVSKEHEIELNKLIKKVEQDVEDLKLNTAIAACMTFIKKIREDNFITTEELKKFLIVLNPLAPHITSEIFEIIFKKDIAHEKWPKYDANKCVASTINLPMQINGKMRGLVEVALDCSQEDAENACYATEKISRENVKKVIYVKNKIINFIQI